MNLRWIRLQWDRFGGWVLIGIGAVALFLGWRGASNTPYPAGQIPFVLSGGIGGALLVAVGATLLISADLRDEWQKLDEIAGVLREQGGSSAVDDGAREEPGEPVVEVVDAAADPELLAVGASTNGSRRGTVRKSR